MEVYTRMKISPTVSPALAESTDTPMRRYLSVAEVAKATGLSQAYWRKAVFRRHIPYVKLGRVLIRREDLESYMACHLVQAEATR